MHPVFGLKAFLQTPAHRKYDEPWLVEEQLISTLSLPLNLDQNARHSFCAVLKAIRKEAADKARELPVVR